MSVHKLLPLLALLLNVLLIGSALAGLAGILAFATGVRACTLWIELKTNPPLRAKTLAIPLPIPLLAPVTMTDRPAIDVNMTFLHNARR